MAAAGLMNSAHAVPILRVFDGTTTLTFVDNGPGDMQPVAGQVVFVGGLGNWTLNVHSGTTYPAVGSLTNPLLDVSFNATSINAGGTLEISFSADGFGPTHGSSELQIGGTLSPGGLLTYQAFGGTNNVLFSTANLLGSAGPFAPGAFSSGTTGGMVSNAGSYSLTQQVTITHGAGTSQTTGNALLRVPEGGTSLLLLGVGLLGVGFMNRFRRKA